MSIEPPRHSRPAAIDASAKNSDPLSCEPDMLIMFRALPRRAQHQFIQLAIDELELDGPAERSADAFLASSAAQIEDGDAIRTSDLYPQGCTHSLTLLRHKVGCARDLLQQERFIMGRAAMRVPRVRVSEPPV